VAYLSHPPPKGLPLNLPKDLHIHPPLPALHVIGTMLMLIWTIHSALSRLSDHPGSLQRPISFLKSLDVVKRMVASLPPSLLEELARDKGKVKRLRKRDITYYGGPPLEKSAVREDK
jgi:hypothetical protein